MINTMNKEVWNKEEYMKVVSDLYSLLHKQEIYELKFDVISKLLNYEITNKQAANILKFTIGHVKKIKRAVKNSGYMVLIHGLKGVCKPRKITDEVIKLLCSIFNGQYAKEKNNSLYDFSGYSYAHLLDHLSKPMGDLYFLGIDISYTSLRQLLIANKLFSVNTHAYKEKHSSSGRLLGRDYAVGERFELDGKFGDWFGTGETYCAHNIYCRGLKKPIATYFDKGETTYGYMMAFLKAVTKFGVPKFVISDERGTFKNLRAEKTEDKYKTRFNEMLDCLGVKYEYTSNPNAKPGVERWNATMGERLPAEIKRKGIKDVVELNEWIDNYIAFEQGDAFERADKTMLGNKLSRELYLRHAIIQRDSFTVTSKHRVMKNNVEYEIMKNGDLRTFPKGKQGYFLRDIDGNVFAEIDNVRYELEVAILVPEEKYQKGNVSNYIRKGQINGTIMIDKSNYVLIQNNGSHLEIATGDEVKVSQNKTEICGNYKGNMYKVVPLDEYENKDMIHERRACKLKFHCLIQYEGIERVAVTSDNRLKYFEDGITSIYVRYKEDGLYGKVDDDWYKIIEKKELDQLIDPIPNSNIAAKRLRNL